MSQSNTSSALRKAGLFYLVFVMFSYTTAGPFGLEDMVSTSGPGMSLVFLLVLPFFWSIPVSLVSAELTTAMPVSGGFYRWTRAAFGDFWGFLAGWWNWSASFLLGGAYAVLFTDYLAYYFPELVGWKHYAVAVSLIAVITWVNVRGIQMVGKFATALEIFISLPVIVMVVMGLIRWHYNPFVPFVVPHQVPFKTFGVGLAIALWGYSGYEQVSSVAEEVENPQRVYPIALALVVPLSIAMYFFPILAGLASAGHWQDWHTRYFSDAAAIIGGTIRGHAWLGTWMTLAGMVCNVALLNATVLTATRMPPTMAEDGYLPEVLAHKHPKYGTPWLGILISALVYAALARESLTQLISVYNWVRAITTVLTVASVWQLRRTHPELPRSFVVPGGTWGLVYVVAAPTLMTAIALAGSDRYAATGGMIALASGPVLYAGIKLFRRRQFTA